MRERAVIKSHACLHGGARKIQACFRQDGAERKKKNVETGTKYVCPLHIIGVKELRGKKCVIQDVVIAGISPLVPFSTLYTFLRFFILSRDPRHHLVFFYTHLGPRLLLSLFQ